VETVLVVVVARQVTLEMAVMAVITMVVGQPQGMVQVAVAVAVVQVLIGKIMSNMLAVLAVEEQEF
jgi:hypothetical protein